MIRITAYDKDWSEREAESSREVIVETLIDRIQIREVAGALSVTHLSPALRPGHLYPSNG